MEGRKRERGEEKGGAGRKDFFFFFFAKNDEIPQGTSSIWALHWIQKC